MRNTHIENLDRGIVPDRLRLEIYKEALQYYLEGKYDVPDMSEGDYGCGLCLVLPCILWGLFNYLDDISPDGRDWDFMNTVLAFPELNSDINLIISIYNEGQKIEKRIELLRNWIKKLENNI